MNIEELREFCLSLPAVTEDIKWEEHLVFSVAGKIFCLAGLEPPLQVALKVPEDQFDELTHTEEIAQASHFARRQWMTVLEESRFSRSEWAAGHGSGSLCLLSVAQGVHLLLVRQRTRRWELLLPTQGLGGDRVVVLLR